MSVPVCTNSRLLTYVFIGCATWCAFFVTGSTAQATTTVATSTETVATATSTPPVATTSEELDSSIAAVIEEASVSTTTTASSSVERGTAMQPAEAQVLNQAAVTTSTILTTMTEDKVLIPAESPYVIRGTFVVPEGTTLTVEAGVVVKFETVGRIDQFNAAGMTVRGQLVVEGTESEPVYFTDWRDDSVGGDSNADADETKPFPGAWSQVRIFPGATATISHAVMRYGGWGTRDAFTSCVNALVNSCQGILMNAGTLTAQHLTLEHTNYFLFHNAGGEATIERSTLIGNGNHAMVYAERGTTSIAYSDISAPNLDTKPPPGVDQRRDAYIDARYNWWGSSTGPSFLNYIAEGTNPAVQGKVEFSPWLTEPVFDGTGTVSDTSIQLWSGAIETDTTFAGDTVHVLLDVIIRADAELVIEPGAILKFARGNSSVPTKMVVEGDLFVRGTETAPVTFTSIRDDVIGGDTNYNGTITAPKAGLWQRVVVTESGSATINHANFRYGGGATGGFNACYSGRNGCQGSLASAGSLVADSISFNNSASVSLHQLAGSSTVMNSLFDGGDGRFIEFYVQGGTSTVRNSSFTGLRDPNDSFTNRAIAANNGTYVDARENWWGDTSGPYSVTVNPAGLGGLVSDNVDIIPWLAEDPLVEPECEGICASSVLFLPGIQASRLYDRDLGLNNRVWEPGASLEVQRLEMTSEGASVNDIYTSDVITEAILPIFGPNIYKGFLAFLEELKSEREIINDFDTFAYDWRYDVFDIVRNGTEYQNGTRHLQDIVEQLANVSKSKKVTIVAHSNGGLLAKALLIEHPELTAKIDNVVFIGTPHLGTPKAIGTILHGYDQQELGGALINDIVARDVIKNLPGAYSLLPSQQYLANTTYPVISFREGEATQNLVDTYGFAATNATEYTDFLNGVEGRVDQYSNISAPYTANAMMLENALINHQLLDAWQPPSEVSVHNFVGVGLQTIAGVEYRTVTENIAGCDRRSANCQILTFVRPYAQLTQYGDKTVSQISADVYGDKYYFDFSDLINIFDFSLFSHANFTEIPQVQSFVENVLTDATSSIEFISDTLPTFTRTFEVIAIDSPVRILVTDEEGSSTGLTEGGNTLEEIEGSSYFEFGGTKYLVVPDDIDYTIELFGENYGGYTMTIASLTPNDEQIIQSELINATTTPDMQATIEYADGTYSTISTDLDGDGAIDFETDLAGTVIQPEQVSYDTVRTAIKALDLPRRYERPLRQTLNLSEYMYQRAQEYRYFTTRFAKLLLEGLDRKLEWYNRRGIITEEQYATLSRLTAKLGDNI